MYWGQHFWGMHLIWWLFWAGLVAMFVYWIARPTVSRRDGALELLRRQYASGAITEDEYRRRLEVLLEIDGRDRGRDRKPRPAA